MSCPHFTCYNFCMLNPVFSHGFFSFRYRYSTPIKHLPMSSSLWPGLAFVFWFLFVSFPGSCVSTWRSTRRLQLTRRPVSPVKIRPVRAHSRQEISKQTPFLQGSGSGRILTPLVGSGYGIFISKLDPDLTCFFSHVTVNFKQFLTMKILSEEFKASEGRIRSKMNWIPQHGLLVMKIIKSTIPIRYSRFKLIRDREKILIRKYFLKFVNFPIQISHSVWQMFFLFFDVAK